jgi:hypothetical protein
LKAIRQLRHSSRTGRGTRLTSFCKRLQAATPESNRRDNLHDGRIKFIRNTLDEMSRYSIVVVLFTVHAVHLLVKESAKLTKYAQCFDYFGSISSCEVQIFFQVQQIRNQPTGHL